MQRRSVTIYWSQLENQIVRIDHHPSNEAWARTHFAQWVAG